MWPRDAYVGQRVVCIDGNWGPSGEKAIIFGCTLPKLNIVYTIRGVAEQYSEIGLYLDELINPKVANFGLDEPAFAASQFKPVDESRLDAFREMLKNVPNRKDVVRADAL